MVALKKKNISIFLAAVFSIFCFSLFADAAAPPARLLVFYSPSCHKCQEVKAKVLPGIAKEFAGKLVIEYLNIDEIRNYEYLLSLKAKYKPEFKVVVPVFYLGQRFLSPSQNLEDNLRKFILDGLGVVSREGELPKANAIDLFRKFNFLGITLAGLEDGINPCAFTVIVFFISYLGLQGYRRRELVVIGLTFILTVFVTYLLIGLGVFNFLYSLRGFWLVTRLLNLGVGILSIILGAFAFYDFLQFRKTGETAGQVLQLPNVIKNRIHAIIGLHYRKGQAQALPVSLAKLIFSAVITGFLVTLLEAICTGQVYLPTIVFMLKTTSLKWQALSYLIYYNLLFIIPLLAVFAFALGGVTSGQFGVFLKRHLATIKILMAILFFSLGVYLVLKA